MEYIFLNQFSSGESFEITASDGIVTIRTLSGERKLGRQMSLEFLYQIRRLSIEGWDDVYYPSEVSGTEANAFLFISLDGADIRRSGIFFSVFWIFSEENIRRNFHLR